MANPDGAPVWYELMTTDADAAAAFYAEVVGWSIAPFSAEGAGRDYRIVTTPDGAGVGGIMTLPKDATTKAGWFSYIGVGDVDATAARVKALGGAVHMGPQDIPGVGRFALVADPQGMAFYVMRGDSPQASRAFDPAAVGHCGWNELITSDHKAALDFYGQVFGWGSKQKMSMGEMGDYCFLDHAGVNLGAMMTAVQGSPARWSYYFRVSSIKAAAQAVAEAGGSVNHGPMKVPTGDHILLGVDPQGAAFALVGGE